ncbi:MAG: 4-hydroxy-tetrahydrodipicolinate synthase [Candidatus Firestonebacteria bacterium]|nr:4-hydroxy-tetrahydrodipicolinate synthase [Candidatus Firestonebacteria bacterium]
MFRGSMVALVTPFENNRVDELRLRALIEFQIANGTHVLVPCGTTGESATLSMAEHRRVIEITVETAAGRALVMAGTGSNNTTEAIELTRAAKSAGANGALLIAPYYNKPTQEGLYRHFMAIAEATQFPFVLYNIQGRTAVNVLPETIVRISEACPLLVGVKEASGSLEQISTLHSLLNDRAAILSGDDALTLPIMAVGGQGVISVVANLVPRATADLVDACLQGNYAAALPLHERLLPLVKAMFLETSPAPVKAALDMMGMCGNELRLPLVPVTDATRGKVRAALEAYGLLSGRKA